jgi:hypothetical protein
VVLYVVEPVQSVKLRLHANFGCQRLSNSRFETLLSFRHIDRRVFGEKCFHKSAIELRFA